MVAAEFPFRDIIGVELSPPLTEIARKNVALVEKQHPGRTRIRIEISDAGAYCLPPGNVVLFLYNPFGEEIIRKVVTGIETAQDAESRTIYVVYYNPVFGACFDASPALKRYYAASIPYAREERGYGPDTADPVVIWQGGGLARPFSGADAPIVITNPGVRAELGG